MRRLAIFALLFFIVLGSFFPAGTTAAAETDWINGELYHREISAPADAEGCVHEKWTIKTDPNKQYGDNEYLPQDVCVYYAQDYAYALYSREYSILGQNAVFSDRGLAVAKNEELRAKRLTPIENQFRNFAGYDFYIGKTEKFAYTSPTETWFGSYVYVIDNFADKLSVNPLTSMYQIADLGARLIDDANVPLRVFGKGHSDNGKWLAIATNGAFYRVDLSQKVVDKAIDGVFYATSMWPSPGYSLYINDTGTYAGSIGQNTINFIVRLDQQCVNPSTRIRSATIPSFDTLCAVRDISPYLRQYSQVGSREVYSFSRMFTDGNTIQYADSASVWHQISFERFYGMEYLALGDSYASGEGDIDSYGKGNYLEGTNIAGDYANGIPREMCHLSENSYPFLLARDAGLVRGNDMNSVACSGAMIANISAVDASKKTTANGFVNGLYYGQSAQRSSGENAPRLWGMTNSNDLQAEAMDKLLPGRVQQIEQLKKYSPRSATVQISGNDLGFGPRLIACAFNFYGGDALKAVGASEEDCDWTKSEFKSALGYTIRDNKQNLVALYQQLKAASPGTQFYAVGYPNFVSQAKVCMNLPGFSPPEIELFNQSIAYANAVIKSAAFEAGFRYIDIEHALDGHTLCEDSQMMTDPMDFVAAKLLSAKKRRIDSEEISRVQWAKGQYSQALLEIIKNDLLAEADIDGMKNTTMLSIFAGLQQFMHPNAIGHRVIAEWIGKSLNGTTLARAECDETVIFCPGVVPTDTAIPAYFQIKTAKEVVVETTGTVVKDAIKAGEIVLVRVNVPLAISLEAAHQLKNLKVNIHSTPTELGKLEPGTDGIYGATLTIPATTVPGFHVLEISGNTLDGLPYKNLTQIFVLGPEDDEDGDGIQDISDDLLFGAPSVTSSDEDVTANDDFIWERQEVVGVTSAESLLMRDGRNNTNWSVTDWVGIQRDGLRNNYSIVPGAVSSSANVAPGGGVDMRQIFVIIGATLLVAALLITRFNKKR